MDNAYKKIPLMKCIQYNITDHLYECDLTS